MSTKTTWRPLSVILIAVIVIAVGAWPPSGGAERKVGANVDSRVMVSFQVSDAALQSWIPAGWQIAPPAEGPSKGANLNLVFVENMLAHDPEGKPAGTGVNRVLALTVPAKNTTSSATGAFVIRIFAGDGGTPGTYKNSAPAQVRRERSTKGSNTDMPSGSERWEIRDASGGTVQLRFDYQGALPQRVKPENNVYSSVEPSFYRIYRWDQGTDVVKSVPNGVDRTQNFQIKIAVAELGKLFDGSEKLVSVALLPWYVREVSLP